MIGWPQSAVCRMHAVAACASKELAAVNLIWDCNMFPWSMKSSFLEPQFYYLLRERASGPKANLTLMNVLTVVEAQRGRFCFFPDLLIWFPFFVDIQSCPDRQFLKHHQGQSQTESLKDYTIHYSPCVVTVNAWHKRKWCRYLALMALIQ